MIRNLFPVILLLLMLNRAFALDFGYQYYDLSNSDELITLTAFDLDDAGRVVVNTEYAGDVFINYTWENGQLIAIPTFPEVYYPSFPNQRHGRPRLRGLFFGWISNSFRDLAGSLRGYALRGRLLGQSIY